MKYTRTHVPFYLLLVLLLALSGCATTKDVAYLQTMEQEVTIHREQLQETRIVPKDIITVNVQASQPELVAAFNGLYWTPHQQYSTTQTGMRTFLVDNDGLVDLPFLGLVHVAGKSVREVEAVVKEKLTTYLNEVPSVNVQLQNFRYSVLGAVSRPGAFTSNNGKVTILDALANAGDMTIYGIREQVKLFRELPDGSHQIITLNLKDPNIVASPYFYLNQGDVIYVMPNDAQASTSNISSGVTIWFSVASIGVSLVNLLATLLR